MLQRGHFIKHKKDEGKGTSARIGIVVSIYNRSFTERLEQKCIGTLVAQGVAKENVDVFHVPGAFEIPLACQRLARAKKYAVIIALGVIIKGDTYHFELIAQECARGVMEVMLQYDTPIIFEVLAGSREDMEKRAADDEYNKGIEAANTAVQLLNSNFKTQNVQSNVIIEISGFRVIGFEF